MEMVIKSKKYGEKVVILDDDQFDKIKDIKWSIVKCKDNRDYHDLFYARGRVPNKLVGKYGQSRIRMHRFLMDAPDGIQVDHINHNGLDNRLCNLRFATHQQQAANSRTQYRSTTGFKGVVFKRKKNLFVCRIRVNGKLIYGGSFKNVFEAALKYNKLALHYFGQYAQINNLTEEQIKLSKEFMPDRIYKTNKTGYRGVSVDSETNMYISTIFLNGKNKGLGLYKTAKEAAVAYNNCLIENNGNLSRLNIIPNE